MGNARVLRGRPSQLERARQEGEVAIEMVASGAAVRMHLQGFRFAERLAPILAAKAQLAGVLFRVERDDRGNPSLVVGPRALAPGAASIAAPPRRILLVEDDATLAGLLARALEANGNRVDAVATAEEAQQLLEHGPAPSLVLLDINLPGESGWSLFERGWLGTASSPPTVVTSAVNMPRSRLRELNVAGYLPKPYALADLIRCVNTIGASEPGEDSGSPDA
jgi:CheY-like chemotaxis protein